MRRVVITGMGIVSPVGTGVEHIAARDSGAAVVAKADGIVEYVVAIYITFFVIFQYYMYLCKYEYFVLKVLMS